MACLTACRSRRCRRLDDDRFADVDDRGVAAGKLFQAAVLAPHRVLADLTIRSAGKAEWRHAAVAGEKRAFRLFQEADGAADAVADITPGFQGIADLS